MASASAAGSPAAAASPGPGPASPSISEAAGPTPAPVPTSSKPGKGRSKDGTARKCANCGQVGHIKTNRKSVTLSKFVCRCEFPDFGDQPVKETKAKSGGRKKANGSGTSDMSGVARTDNLPPAVLTGVAFALGSLAL